MAPAIFAFGAASGLLACSDGAPGPAAQARAPVPIRQVPIRQVPIPAPPPATAAVDRAAWSEGPPVSPEDRRAVFVRAQVLLDRAHFSPGVIDGQDGENMRHALAAFEAANGLPQDGRLDADVWAALTRDARPAMAEYEITPADVAGPFAARIPTDYVEMARLPSPAYTSVVEALAERFHMDEALLRALNPGADLTAAGTKIVVAAPGGSSLPARVARLEVDKDRRQVRAYGEGGKLVAVYPATVGSSERPAPDGEWAVRAVAPDPTYTFDPARLTFGKPSYGKLTIRPGPNSPVGSTWIDLTKDTYGIHGSADPRLVGKVASHGCVRLANWDAKQLGAAVQAGTKVVFMGRDPRMKKKA